MFSETLRLQLDLTIKNQIFTIPGGNIKEFSVDLFNYGFQAKVTFWVCEEYALNNELFNLFSLPDLIEARLSIQGVYNLPTPPPDPLIVKGLVTGKSFIEETFPDIQGNPVLFRRFSVYFADPAQVLWCQHFPIELYVDSKMSEVIEAQIVEGISLRMDWDVLEVERPIICLGLGCGKNKAAFYDFLLWFVDSQGGVWSYDSTESTYKISDSKKDTYGKVLELKATEVERVQVDIPDALRYNVKILNANSEIAKTEEIEQDQPVDGIYRDILVRTSIPSVFDERKRLETTRLKNKGHELKVVFSQFPTISFHTGAFVRLAKEIWSPELYSMGEDYSVNKLHIIAQAEDENPEHDNNIPYSAYKVDMTAALERKKDPCVTLPPFKKPQYPVLVEGKIFCPAGETNDRTYIIINDKDTSRDFYKVDVPLWNKKIMVPFEPGFFTGHFYFPAFKESRVFLALYFDSVEIKRFLDWGVDVRLPESSQGNHLLMGKNKTSETSIKHVYEDNKPIFSIHRVDGVDSELLKLEEGTIILQTKEDPSLKKKEERYDLTPKVFATQSELSFATKSAISDITASYTETKSGIKGKLEGTIADTETSLETTDSEISGKIAEISTQMESALQQLTEKTQQLTSKVKSVKTELMGKISL